MARLNRVSLPDSEDFRNDLLAAKERDLKPLLEESADVLDLDYDQTMAMEDFLNLAWLSGTRSGHAQMRARATEPQPDVKAEFKALMEESADRLNLSVPRTISMWGLLHQAWMAGNRTCEAEIMALLIETKSDVAEEALQWLEDRDES